VSYFAKHGPWPQNIHTVEVLPKTLSTMIVSTHLW
jgi:hypothetical protein